MKKKLFLAALTLCLIVGLVVVGLNVPPPREALAWTPHVVWAKEEHEAVYIPDVEISIQILIDAESETWDGDFGLTDANGKFVCGIDPDPLAEGWWAFLVDWDEENWTPVNPDPQWIEYPTLTAQFEFVWIGD